MRSHNAWVAIIQVISGLLLWITPNLFDLGKHYSLVNYVAAPIICCIGIIALSDLNRNASKINLLTSLFVIIGTWWLAIPNTAFTFNIITAILILLTALVKRKAQKNYGGGWRSLFDNEPLHLKVAEKENESKP